MVVAVIDRNGSDHATLRLRALMLDSRRPVQVECKLHGAPGKGGRRPSRGIDVSGVGKFHSSRV